MKEDNGAELSNNCSAIEIIFFFKTDKGGVRAVGMERPSRQVTIMAREVAQTVDDDCEYDAEGNVIGWEEVGEEETENNEELLPDEEFDLYNTLKLARGEWENLKIEAQSRAAYHRLALKWHPSNFKSRPVICDACTARLTVGSDWFHLAGDVYDVCSECYLELAENEKGGYVMISKEEDLGEEKGTYLPELEKQRKRDEAIKMFKRVALAYRVLGKDHELRQIYDTLGWQGLVKADVYAQVSIFSINAFAQYEDFFAGVDEDDRQYLLMNGKLPMSPTAPHLISRVRFEKHAHPTN